MFLSEDGAVLFAGVDESSFVTVVQIVALPVCDLLPVLPLM